MSEDYNQNTQQEVIRQFNAVDKNVEINGKTYTFDPHRIKFSHIQRLAAKLKSGMTARLTKDPATGEDITEMAFTLEYAEQEGQVIVELVRTLYALDIDLDSVPLEVVDTMIINVIESGFIARLQRLNEITSAKKKNS